MRILIIYDSIHGNTKKIALAIAKGLNPKAEVNVCAVKNLKPEDTQQLDIVIIGSSTQGKLPTKAIVKFLDSIPDNNLHGIGVAAFDTRHSESNTKSTFFGLFKKDESFAAKVISQKLKSKGGQQVVLPEGFLITSPKGPLKAGELERAKIWFIELI